MTMGAPPITIWLNAINKGWFTSFPGLASSGVRQFCTNKTESAKGHMKPQRQHTASTKPKSKPRSNIHFFRTEVMEARNELSMDMTGRHPISSRRGHKCILIMTDIDSNHVKLIPSKSRKAEACATAHQAGHDWFKDKGIIAKLLRLDNEVSNLLIQTIKKDNLKMQLASPDDNRQLPAERSIQDAKSHFISIRCIADKSFPDDNWDLLLRHTEDTLNMLRPSKMMT